MYRNWNKWTNKLEKGKTKFPTAALLKVQIFWDVTLCCVSSCWNFKELHCLQLQDQAFTAGSWRHYNDSECWELWRNIPCWLLDPGDEGTAILQNYLPTVIALYARRHGGGSKLCNYALHATMREAVRCFIYTDCSGCNTKTTTILRYLHTGIIEVLTGTHKVWRGPAE
jgi:hypothetical protein